MCQNKKGYEVGFRPLLFQLGKLENQEHGV